MKSEMEGSGNQDLEFHDPTRIARENVVPPNGTPQTSNEFVKAVVNAELVNIEPPKTLEKACLYAAAKINAVKTEAFKMPDKVREFADALENNFRLLPLFKLSSQEERDLNTIGFYSGPAGECELLPHVDMIDSKNLVSTQRLASTALTVEMLLTLTSCNPIKATQTETIAPASSPMVEISSTTIPGILPTRTTIASLSTPLPTTSVITSETQVPSLENPTQTPTSISPTETISPVKEVAAYPSSLENLNATPSVFGSEAESKLAEYGLKEDLNAIKDWYRANGIKDENMVAVINEAGGTWNLMVKAEDGHFLKFTITNGLEAGQVVRDMGMIAYLNKEASTRFTTLEIPNPDGFENAVQKPIGAKSGWNIIGAFEGDTLVAWFDANTDNGGAWELLPNAATATPENSLLTGDLSGLAAAPDMTVDSAGLHITLPDSSRVMNVTTENVGKQVVFDSEYSLYKIYDANGNISAEYDPGQGKEGDVDYVPSTGWVDVQKLAKDLVCKKGNGVNCITSYSDSHVVDKSVWYETNSIGIFRYLEVKDPSTGENLGRVLLLQMASRNDLQNPITSWFLVQEEASYDPGVNRLNSVVQMVLVDTKDFSLYKKGELYDLSQWIGWMPKGSMWTFSFAKSGWDYTYLLKKNAPVSDDVSQDAIDFISSNGETSPEGGVILRANGSSGREAMK